MTWFRVFSSLQKMWMGPKTGLESISFCFFLVIWCQNHWEIDDRFTFRAFRKGKGEGIAIAPLTVWILASLFFKAIRIALKRMRWLSRIRSPDSLLVDETTAQDVGPAKIIFDLKVNSRNS